MYHCCKPAWPIVPFFCHRWCKLVKPSGVRVWQAEVLGKFVLQPLPPDLWKRLKETSTSLTCFLVEVHEFEDQGMVNTVLASISWNEMAKNLKTFDMFRAQVWAFAKLKLADVPLISPRAQFLLSMSSGVQCAQVRHLWTSMNIWRDIWYHQYIICFSVARCDIKIPPHTTGQEWEWCWDWD